MDLRGKVAGGSADKRFVDACSANAQIVLWRLPGLVEEIIAIGTNDGVPAARTLVKSHVAPRSTRSGYAHGRRAGRRAASGSGRCGCLSTDATHALSTALVCDAFKLLGECFATNWTPRPTAFFKVARREHRPRRWA